MKQHFGSYDLIYKGEKKEKVGGMKILLEPLLALAILNPIEKRSKTQPMLKSLPTHSSWGKNV